MKASYHNGRVKINGHNDRNFNHEKSDGHIDFSKSKDNFTWKIYRDTSTFSDTEEKYYINNFSDWLNERNKKAIEQRHPERCKTMDDIMKSRQSCPEETILQIGNKDNHVSADLAKECCLEFVNWFMQNYGDNCKTLDVALHVDEATPHLQWRKVWQYEENGMLKVGQDKALERMGIDLPDPTKPKGRRNNRKQTFDAMVRKKWYEVCQSHGIELDIIPEKREHMNKQDYIIFNQNRTIEQLTVKEKELEREVLRCKLDVHRQENRLDQLNSSVSLLEGDRATLEADIGKLTDKKKNLQADVSGLIKDVDFWKKRKAHYFDEYEVAKKNYEDYEKTHSIGTLKAEYEQKRADLGIDALEHEKTVLLDEIEPLRAEKSRLINGYNVDGTHYLGIKELRERKNSLQETIEKLETTLKSKIEDIISTFMKSVKFAIPMAMKNEPDLAESELLQGQQNAHAASAELPKPAELGVNEVVDQTTEKVEEVFIRPRKRGR